MPLVPVLIRCPRWREGHGKARGIQWRGEVAPVTREILRRAEPDRSRHPHVHAG